MSHPDQSLPTLKAVPQRPTQLALIRHGEVEEAYQRIFGGRIDMNLSPQGHAQAITLAKWLARQPLDAVYASPMKRVQQTLAPFIENNDWATRVVTADALREVDFGDWTGCTWEGIREKFGVSAFQWLSELDRGGIANAENAQSYRERVDACLRNILERHTGQNVAIFCHGGVIRMILSILLDIPLPGMAGFEIDYASVTSLAIVPHRTEVQFLNFTPWAEAAL